MCSVAGIITRTNAQKHLDELKTMMFYLHHRGPDENNILSSENVLLGNTRLSVLDIHNHGTQPTCFNGIYVVFNGEIYNYKLLEEELKKGFGIDFQTHCDTEVLPYLYYYYGESFVTKLDGQFAILLYDSHENKLFAYRDRLGKKPLYYSKRDGNIYFASEMRALRSIHDYEISSDEMINVVGLWSYDRSFYADITSVPEGSYLEVDISTLQIKESHYYDLCAFMAPGYIQIRDKEEAKVIVKDSIAKAVKKRLLSDVGYGLYLSGGLDSTILASHLVEENPRIKTYSVAFPESGSFNEQYFQKKVADYYGVENISVEITKEDLYNAFEEYVLFSDSIVFRTAPIPMSLLSKVASASERVIFSGEGSDELFFGYDIFKEVKYSRLMASRSQKARDHFIKELYPYMLNDMQLKFMQISLLGNRQDEFSSHMLRLKNIGQFEKFMKIEPTPTLLERYRPSLTSLHPLKRAQLIEYKTLLLNYLLSVQGDLAAMKNSIELRAPFLDTELIQNVMKIDPKILFPLFKEKHLLKEIYASKLPDEVLKRYKQPYRAPDAVIFQGKNEVLEKISAYKNFGCFDREKVLALTKKVISSESVSYVESFYFLIIYSGLILMNRQFAKPAAIKINNLIEVK